MAKKIVKAITDVKPNKDKPISIKANPIYGRVCLGVQVFDRGKWVKFRFAHPAEEQHPQVKITQTGQESIYVLYKVCKDLVDAKKAKGIAPEEGMFGNLHSRYYFANVRALQVLSEELVGA